MKRKPAHVGRTRWTSRRALATYYFPDVTPKSAVNRLRRWILADPQMRHALEKAGYQPLQRVFPPKVMRVFRYYIS